MISAMLIGLFMLFMFLRVPVAMALGLATILSMLAGGYDLMTLPQKMAASVQSIELMAIPFFILAASLMNALGITQQIFAFATALVGHLRGGLAHANVIAGMIFSGISGAAVADAAALGAISMKEMPKAGYPRAFSAATVIAVATLGPIIPPSIMMVIYAIIANVSIARLFIAGILPGLLIGAMLMMLIWFLGRGGVVAYPPPQPFSWRDLLTAMRKAVLALLAPIVILRGMAAGWTTPTEAGILAVFYSIAVGAIQRNLTFDKIRGALRETVEASGLIMYIIAVSTALSWVVVAEGTAGQLAELVGKYAHSAIVFLLVTNLFLIIIGGLIETLPAMLIALPILLPPAKALGIDMVHFGMVVIFNLVVGIMTPPMGIGLFILAAISKLRMGEIVWATIPFHIVLLIALLLITLFPQITLWLPNALMN
ncbi:MAG: TRAP transporter large permease [Betaproteobacteria bacterium]